MAKSSSANEKRQEERLIQELRDFQRSNVTNRRCFDCNEMMPQYVCLDFNTFVCTACSGIHREFAHRVKSISMSKFTESEVKNMVKFGGNEAAQKYWRAKHDPSFRPNGGSDGERTRNFIRLTYIDRKWVYESPRHAKDEEPERTSSKSSKSKKEMKAPAADSGDDFFSSSSKPAKASSSGNDGGFAQFGDFSQFDTSSKPAASPSFGDFGNFDTAATAKKADDGFADFGGFEGSTASSSGVSAPSKATPKAAPAFRNFDSFKIAPPPGSQFSSPPANTTLAPVVNDLMGTSPPKKAEDPFGFDTPAPTLTPQNTQAPVASSPFDAFDAPTPTSRAGSRSSSISLDPFSNVVTVAPSVPVTTKQNTSPFDAFGSPAPSPASAFDDFAAPSPAPTASSNVFDAFGGGGDDFGDFTGSNSSSRTSSANPPAPDPFASMLEKPAAAAVAADPFAAFDDMQASKPAPSAPAPTPGFGATDFSGSSVSKPASTDPFAFASGSPGNGFSAGISSQQQQHSGSNVASQPFGGFPGTPGHQIPQHQQQPMMPQNAFNHQMQQSMQPINQGPPSQTQQQQWYGQTQGFPGQQQPMHPTGQQFPGQQFPDQLPPRVGVPPPAPAQVKASAASINDPFASLNIGSAFGFSGSSTGSTSTSGPPSRTGSGVTASTAPFAPQSRSGATNSFGSGAAAPVFSAHVQASSFAPPPQNPPAFADPNAFGDFTSAPVQKPASSANPFDLF
ncbi:hypothetical protein PHYBOEH_009473 [Phytophthora boehmeriae]|uniref:Arf-GAP domain-containing protein n=1 Tax=Phytophthora boehmeriae TaxID=109152 RepID=A0A8T1XCY0_9STRA|nr:hypothetical protein PHYBOEH_009473 [Phytophthora boehmeriae]